MPVNPNRALYVKNGTLIQLRLPGGQSTTVPPTATNDSFVTPHETTVVLNILANDVAGSSPINTNSVQIVSHPSSGSVQVNSNGTVAYTPASGFSGSISFTYRVSDTAGRVSNTATVSGTVAAAPSSGDGGLTLPTAIRTINVSNSADLASAMAVAQPGDHIVLANGTYSKPPRWDRDGTSDRPIVLRAANLLEARLPSLNLGGAYQYCYGIHFNSSESQVGNGRQARNCAFWRCKFTGVSNQASTAILIRTYNSLDLDFAYCEFTGHSGRYVSLNATAGDRRTRLRRCYWHDQPNFPQNSTEPIQISFGGGSQSRGISQQTLVEYCLFENMTNDSECIAVKSSDNVIYRCTFINTNSVSNRDGENNRYEALYMNNTTGMSTFDGPASGSGRGNLFLGILTLNDKGSADNKIFAGDKAPGSPDSSRYSASRNCVIAGCSFDSTLRVGYLFSGVTVTHNATNTRIRQHQGNILLENHSNTDSQPGVNETQYSWDTRVILTSDDVGPNAVTEEPSEPEPATPAQLFLNPFSKDSAHHRPIGTGAIYVKRAALAAHAGSGAVINGGGGNLFGHTTGLATESDPSATISISGGSGNMGSTVFLNNLEASFPSPETNEASSLIGYSDSEPYAAINFYAFKRATLSASIAWKYDIRGLGHGTSLGNRIGTSAFGGVGLFGCVRKHEVESPGMAIRHAHHIFVPRLGNAQQLPNVLKRTIQWPAVTGDGNAGEGSNNTESPGYQLSDMLGYGALVAIRPQDLSNLLSAIQNSTAGTAAGREAAQRLATAFCHYGIYCIDGGNQVGFRGDAEFVPGLANAIRDIFRAVGLWDWCYEVTNSVTGNTATISAGPSYSGNIGTPTWPAGGGTPLAVNSGLI